MLGTPTFFEQFDPDQRSKDKEKLKKYQAEVESVKKQQMEE